MHNCLVLFQIRCLYNYDIENVVSYALETHKYVSNDLKKKKDCLEPSSKESD